MKSPYTKIALSILLCLCVTLSVFGETPFDAKSTVNNDISLQPGMVLVPEGSYISGAEGFRKGIQSIYLDAFFIDVTEVTVDAYKKCVDDKKCTPPETKGRWCKASIKKNNWTEGRLEHPINCVNWTQAKEYCAWAGKRLPSKYEWEKAARGTDGREYPWGNQPPTCELLIAGRCDRDRESAVPGSAPAGVSPYGAMDMAGNMEELTENLTTHGGCYASSGIVPSMFSPAYSQRIEETSSSAYLGFRCAK